jgi:hypothetical protein
MSTDATDRCANCGAEVLSRYCADCGQRVSSSKHSVWHFLREATEDVTHADSRLWQTLLALLFRPGHLTREFLEGRRARYLPPIRLYLVLSVLFFLVGSAGFHSARHHAVVISDRGAVSLAPLDEPVAAKSADKDDEEVENFVRSAMSAKTPRERAQRLCGGMSGNSWLPIAALKASCFKVVEDNGRQFMEQFTHNLPRAMFVFLPLLALFMQPLYWRPRRYYVEHLLFFVHDHAFVFLLLSVYWLLTALTLPHDLRLLLGIAVGLYLPWYLYRSMRRVYQQGRALTTLKFVTLSLAYLIIGGIMLLLLSLYSFMTV